MTSVVTWYDVLGVLPDAMPDDIREAWQERKDALQPGRLAGAAPNVLAAAGVALKAVDEAWRVLGDPTARNAYDEAIGFQRPGEGLAPPSPLPEIRQGNQWYSAEDDTSEASRPSRVVVPDVVGLFYHSCQDVTGRVGLHLALVQLTAHPMPVEGLVVGQAPAPGKRAHRNSTLTVQVWHPPEPG